jgi:hypothetical protein
MVSTMRIKLHFPTAAIEGIKALGLRQINPETLRWTTDHHESHYGMGVILRGKSGVILDGRTFAVMSQHFGAWIEVDSAATKKKCELAMCSIAVEGLSDRIIVTDADKAKI